VGDVKAGESTGEIEVASDKGKTLVLVVTAKTELTKRVGKQRVSTMLSEIREGDVEVMYSTLLVASDPPMTAAYRATILMDAK
jgi:hypothetical protein